MAKTSLLSTLMERRVPQIVGLYIAATWMMIEIGDWIAERFHLAQELTSYIFIGMIIFLPSVILLAYQYGKKGKESWQKSTFFVVPVNLIASAAGMYFFVQPLQATEIKSVVDETGKQQTFEVAKSEFQKGILVSLFPMSQELADLEWLQHGLPIALSMDLNRSIFLNAMTPISSKTMLDDFNKRGFSKGLKVPYSLMIEQAKERFFDFLIMGRIDRKEALYSVSIDLRSVKTGKLIGQLTLEDSDIFQLVDELSKHVQTLLELPEVKNSLAQELPLSEHFTASKEAFQNYTQAFLDLQLDQNYDAAEEKLNLAISLDQQFVSAKSMLAGIYRSKGKPQDALAEFMDAMKYDYKITERDKFLYRSSIFALKGDVESMLKVLDMWIDIYPDDSNAHSMMVRMQMSTGFDLDKAQKSLERLRELTPENDNVIMSIASLHLLKRDFNAAIEAINAYIERNPSILRGHLSLAGVYERMGAFDKAQDAYDNALLFEPDDFQTRLSKAYMEFKQGDTEATLEEIEHLTQLAQTNREKLSIHNTLQMVLFNEGKLRESIDQSDRMSNELTNQSVLDKLFGVDFRKISMLIELGDFELAHQKLSELKEQLQPPYDRYVDTLLITSYFYQKKTEELRQVLEELSAYVEKTPNPWLEQRLDVGKMYLSELTGDYESALQLATTAMETLGKSSSTSANSVAYLMQASEVARYRMLAGNVEQSINESKDILNVFPAFSLAKLTLLEAFIISGKKSEALQVVEKLENVWRQADNNYQAYQRFTKLKEQAKAL